MTKQNQPTRSIRFYFFVGAFLELSEKNPC
jgi:hypothetical protein